MINGYTNTSPGIFHSGDIGQTDVQTISQLAESKPVVIFAMQDQKQDVLQIPLGWSLLWWDRPDDPPETAQEVAAIFMRVGKVAKIYHDAGYVIWFHCMAGCNRSTMGNIAYRVVALGETAQQAFQNIKDQRPSVGLAPRHIEALEFMVND